MINVVVKDSGGSENGSCVFERDGVAGQVSYTREFSSRNSTTRPFLNPLYGNNLAQNAAVGGTPINISDGGDSAGWTAAAILGGWDFSDTVDPYSGSNCVSLTSGNNNDEASFTGASVIGANYSSITLKIQLDSYNDIQNNITLRFLSGGISVGVTVTIDNYIDTAIIGSYQSVVIPLTDLEIENLSFDECRVLVFRGGGSRPTFRFDEFRVEEQGGSIRFQVSLDPRKIYFINQIRFTFANNVTGNLALDYDKILGVTLANGLVITRIAKDGPVVGRSISSATDFYSFGFNKVNFDDDGTNTVAVFEVNFSRPLELNALYEETINIDINDDLSGFLVANAVARGESESINTGGKLIL